MPHHIAAVCDQSLRAADLPVVSVSIGREDDRSTWTAQLAAGASAAQHAEARTLLDTVDLTAGESAYNATIAAGQVDAPVTAAVLGAVFALVAEHGPGSGEEWSSSDLRQRVIDILTPLL